MTEFIPSASDPVLYRQYVTFNAEKIQWTLDLYRCLQNHAVKTAEKLAHDTLSLSNLWDICETHCPCYYLCNTILALNDWVVAWEQELGDIDLA